MEGSPVAFGFPARYVLRAEPDFKKSISAIWALVKRHVPLVVAKAEIERVLAGGQATVDLPMLEDAATFEAEMRGLGVTPAAIPLPWTANPSLSNVVVSATASGISNVAIGRSSIVGNLGIGAPPSILAWSAQNISNSAAAAQNTANEPDEQVASALATRENATRVNSQRVAI